MKDNLISIIIPIYNAQQYLQRTITSVLNQDYATLEIILINDGSSDGSLNICEEFALRDQRIKVFNQINQGVSSARNRGLIEASGDWILFLDSDDCLYSDNCLTKCMNHSSDKYDIIIGDIVYVFSDRERVFKQISQFEINFENISKLLLTDKIAPALHSKLYRKWLFENLLFDKNLKIGEDFAMNVQLLQKTNKIIFIDLPIYCYIQRDNSVIHKPSTSAIDSIPLFVIFVVQFYQKSPLYNNISLEINHFILSRYYLYFLYGGKNDNLTFITIVKKAICESKKNIPLVRYCILKISLFNNTLGSLIKKPLLLLQSKPQ